VVDTLAGIAPRPGKVRAGAGALEGSTSSPSSASLSLTCSISMVCVFALPAFWAALVHFTCSATNTHSGTVVIKGGGRLPDRELGPDIIRTSLITNLPSGVDLITE